MNLTLERSRSGSVVDHHCWIFFLRVRRWSGGSWCKRFSCVVEGLSMRLNSSRGAEVFAVIKSVFLVLGLGTIWRE